MTELIFAGVQVAAGCLVVYFALNIFRQKQKSQKREDIQKLEAKMSALRMMLKAKVKKKSAFFRATFGQPIKSCDPIDIVLSALTEITFETGPDFQGYFDISKKLNNYMFISEEKFKVAQAAAIAIGEKAAVPQVVGAGDPEKRTDANGFMTNDVKNEFAILRIMNEMIQLSHHIKTRSQNFNESNPKNLITIAEPLNFPAMAEIKRVFSDNPEQVKVEPTTSTAA